MLSLFPNLLWYPLFAYMILRLVVAYETGFSSITHWKAATGMYTRILAALEVIAAVLVLIGLYTQGALLAVILITVIHTVVEIRQGVFSFAQKKLSFIVAIIALALLFTGPGSFAFDLPL